jgi:hypothetical protein
VSRAVFRAPLIGFNEKNGCERDAGFVRFIEQVKAIHRGVVLGPSKILVFAYMGSQHIKGP